MKLRLSKHQKQEKPAMISFCWERPLKNREILPEILRGRVRKPLPVLSPSSWHSMLNFGSSVNLHSALDFGPPSVEWLKSSIEVAALFAVLKLSSSAVLFGSLSLVLESLAILSWGDVALFAAELIKLRFVAEGTVSASSIWS